MRHCASGLVLERPLEALDCLAMVEPEHPVEASVEPKLGLGRRRRDFAAVRPEIKIGHALFALIEFLPLSRVAPASTATNPRKSIPLGFEAAVSRAATETSVRASAR